MLHCIYFSSWRPPKCCTVCSFGPGRLQSAVLYACWSLEGSKMLYCIFVFGLATLQSVVLYACLALEAPKVVYCMHFWLWRPPKCCTVCILAPGGLPSGAVRLLARAPLQRALLDAVHTPSSTLRPSIRFCLPPPPPFYPQSDKPYFVTTDMMLGRSASDTNKLDFGV